MKPDNQIKLSDIRSANDAALEVGYSSRVIRQWCDEGRIEAKKFGMMWLVYMPSLIAFVKNRRKPRLA